MANVTTVLMLFLLLLPAGASAFDPLFYSRIDYRVGGLANSVCAADFDGDGDFDLASTKSMFSELIDSVSILFNNGDGSFQSAVSYSVGASPKSVVAGDFDGDSDIDLAVSVFRFGNISVLLNNGDGTFQDAIDYGHGDGAVSVYSADIDIDGDLDLSVAVSGTLFDTGYVAIFINNGDGTFQDAVTIEAGDEPLSICAGDLDNDGDNDLVVANYDNWLYPGEILVYLNHGDGTFQDIVAYEVGYRPQSVIVADLNGDPYKDLAVANSYSDTISILINNGDGTFLTATNYAAWQRPYSIFASDLDDDGDNDLTVACELSNDISIFYNNGNGTFQEPLIYRTGAWPRSVSVVDLDGDGIKDIAIANDQSEDVSILINNGDGTFQGPLIMTPGTTPFLFTLQILIMMVTMI
jgi:hypothetical protein